MAAARGNSSRPLQAGCIRLTVARGRVQQDEVGFPLYVEIGADGLRRLGTGGIPFDPKKRGCASAMPAGPISAT